MLNAFASLKCSKGKARKLRQLCQSSENLQLSQRNDRAEPATIARDRSPQSTKEKKTGF